MFKYNNFCENLEPYRIPSTTNYKYKMDMGEWNLPIHPLVNEELQNFNTLYRYGVLDDDFNYLINLIKKYNNLLNNNETILLTNGSDNALRLILELFATENSKFLIPTPTYAHFECMLETHKIKEINKPYIDYKLSNNEFYELLKKELLNNFDLCYLVNPSMPVGHILSIDNLQNLLSNNPNTIFVIDEAYIEFSKNNSCSTLTETNDNLIVVRTFSKFFSLASLRLGYLITNEKIIKLLKPYYNYKDITKLSINCAIKSLENINFYDENKNLYFKLKNNIINQLDTLIKNNNKITDYIMNDGMYFTIICKNPENLKNYFDNHSIAVRNKDADIKGAIRLTINTEEIINEVFALLNKY